MALQDYLPRQFNMMPPVVKNLLIINVLFFLARVLVQKTLHEDLNRLLGLHYPESVNFKSYQILTSMFSHGNFTHILFNMFALWMFGSQLERIWGSSRFFMYFIITGLGASLLHTAVNWYEVQNTWALIPADVHSDVVGVISGTMEAKFHIELHPAILKLNMIYNSPVVGASGAIYGLLIGFGMLFPNVELMLIFLPVPIKAKYFIPMLMVLELYLGVNNFSWDNIAHFAHLGGALFGFILIKYWSRGSHR